MDEILTIGGEPIVEFQILKEIADERARQKAIGNAEQDATNTRNDWIAFITAYVGRSADKCFRNQHEGQDFRANMLKVAALAVAAIEAHDAGHC